MRYPYKSIDNPLKCFVVGLGSYLLFSYVVHLYLLHDLPIGTLLSKITMGMEHTEVVIIIPSLILMFSVLLGLIAILLVIMFTVMGLGIMSAFGMSKKQ